MMPIFSIINMLSSIFEHFLHLDLNEIENRFFFSYLLYTFFFIYNFRQFKTFFLDNINSIYSEFLKNFSKFNVNLNLNHIYF